MRPLVNRCSLKLLQENANTYYREYQMFVKSGGKDSPKAKVLREAWLRCEDAISIRIQTEAGQ